jgi:formate hydrogenlyase subunit 6/NADH:ubiquinone oxidoreductase subunit I
MEELFWMRKEVRMKQKAYPAPDRKNCKDNCVEYCPTNCLSMTEEYEFSTYDRHELNYNQ